MLFPSVGVIILKHQRNNFRPFFFPYYSYSCPIRLVPTYILPAKDGCPIRLVPTYILPAKDTGLSDPAGLYTTCKRKKTFGKVSALRDWSRIYILYGVGNWYKNLKLCYFFYHTLYYSCIWHFSYYFRITN